MRNKILKIIAMFVLVVFISREIFSIGSTWSFFSDVEVSQNNIFQAGTLDLEVSSPTDNFVSNFEEDGGSNASGYWMSREAEVLDSGDVPFRYTIKTGNISGSEKFCGDLGIMAALEGNTEYMGDLSGFSVSDVEFEGSSDKWLFAAYSKIGGSLNENCAFKLIFEAVQKNEDVFEGETGFTDEEEIGNLLNSGGVVLNEFLPNPSGSEAFGEWVELYNTSDHEIDVAGWVLYDSDDHELEITPCHVEGDLTIVPPKGFMVIYRKTGKKCSSDFTLNNSEDEVKLYTDLVENGGVLVDSYAYDNEHLEDIEATPGEGNDEPKDGDNGSENDNRSQTDKSYARFPDGTGPWFDPIPTPGMPNVLEGENGEDETDDVKNEEDNGNEEHHLSVGYLNGEIEVIIDNETGDIVEIVGEGDISLEKKEGDPDVRDEKKDHDEDGFVEARDISEDASSYYVN